MKPKSSKVKKLTTEKKEDYKKAKAKSQDRRMSQKETKEEPKEVIGERASTCGKVL